MTDLTRSQHGDSADLNGQGLGLWATVAIGVGGMVGGGIFAVLGLSVELTQGGAPIAFAVAGLVAALTASSYAKLAVRYPDRGGTITYLNEGFGGGLLSGGLNVLLWLSYIILLSLYASAFGSYFLTLLPGDPPDWASRLALSGAIVGLTALNGASAASVGKAEEWIVAAKVIILTVFVAAGMTAVQADRLAPAEWASPVSIVGGGMLIFVAYEGFELIANAAEDVDDPAKILPRAFAVSVGFVAVLYVLVAIVTVGVLSLDEISTAEDFALSEAARPRFGQAGFSIIAIAALLSTASAINATLYGSTRLTYSIATSGELPKPFGRSLRGGFSEGLLITSALTLVAANTLDLSRISTMGSAGFLIIFAAVNAAQYRLRRPGDKAWLPLSGVIACLVALIALIVEAGGADPIATTIAGLLVAGSFGIEAIYRKTSGRTISDRFQPTRRSVAHQERVHDSTTLHQSPETQRTTPRE